MDKLRVVHIFAGAEFFQGLQKAGIVHRDLAGDYGIVMVQDQTGVFEHSVLSFVYGYWTGSKFDIRFQIPHVILCSMGELVSRLTVLK